MAELVRCPKCNNELTSRNRLITENCGHTKCRECLISEENGCKECQQNEQAQLKKINITEEMIEDKYLPANVPSTYSPEKSRTGKVAFPSHVVKECTDNKVVYLCTVCDKRFNSRTQQYYHLFCNNSSNKPYKCEQCIKTFSTSSHLKYHMDGHSPHKSFTCKICGKTFAKLQILRKHEKLHTALAQECIECGIKFKTKLAFTAHLQRHKNIFTYSCNVCEKKFSLKSTLRMHKTVHGGTKKFKCDQCDKKFDRNSTLKLHTLRHSKQKKYRCSECYKQFIDMKTLMRHSKIHAETSKYKCTLCDTTSIRKDNITRHLRNMHSNESKDCIEIINQELEKVKNITCTDKLQPKQLIIPNGCTGDANESNVPKIVVNSSVIRSIGNVQPVIIPKEKESEIKTNVKAMPAIIHPATTHKKLKKKYDPHEIYRKILLDDDSTTENDTNSMSETTHPTIDQTQVVQETTALCNGQQSNFSETHWRKNFKYTYQIQFD